MSPAPGYLQGGRRRRSRAGLGVAVLAVVAIAAATVVVFASVGRHGGRTHPLGGSPAVAEVAAPPPARARKVSTYATVAEPAGLRVRVQFRHPPRSAMLVACVSSRCHPAVNA